MKNLSAFVVALTVFLPSFAWSAPDKGVSFVTPVDGGRVSSPVRFKMAVTGMEVRPAGDMTENTGHHHILINKPCIPAGQVIGMDDGMHHFGKGQTEAELEVPVGLVSVSLQFANGAHVSYGPEMCTTIMLHVEEKSALHDPWVSRGRYLVKIAGCNDCHTPGYAPKNGEVPEDQWLIGDPTGWKGPWGTTYAINLRAHVAVFSEDDWVKVVRTGQPRPPMPWYMMREMEESDIRSIYRYIRSLPGSSATVPAALPPGEKPSAPYFELVLPVPPSAGNPH